MKRIWTFLFVCLAILIAAAALRPGSTPGIDGPRAIASLESVEIGGVEQWVLIRGRDVGHPVLLLLHGGPGLANMGRAEAHSSELEEHYVVVHWDQRGAGKSCSSEVPPESITREQLVSDTLELSSWLRDRFDKEKIYLLGHSWGSVLGTLAVERAPELFFAYVGLGQVVDQRRGEEISHRWVTDRAEADGNGAAIEQLASIHPQHAKIADLQVHRRWLGHYGGDRFGGGALVARLRGLLATGEYTMMEKLRYVPCALDSVDRLWSDVLDVDFIRDVPRLETPVYFFAGRHDYNTPFELVEEWASRLEAPNVEVLWFEHSAHMADVEESELFQQRLIDLREAS